MAIVRLRPYVVVEYSPGRISAGPKQVRVAGIEDFERRLNEMAVTGYRVVAIVAEAAILEHVEWRAQHDFVGYAEEQRLIRDAGPGP